MKDPLVEHSDRRGVWVRESTVKACPMCGGDGPEREHEDCRPW